MRGKIAFKEMMRERLKKVMAIRVQLFYKKRFSEKQRASVLLQKMLKRYRTRKWVQVQLKIWRASERLRNLI